MPKRVLKQDRIFRALGIAIGVALPLALTSCSSMKLEPMPPPQTLLVQGSSVRVHREPKNSGKTTARLYFGEKVTALRRSVKEYEVGGIKSHWIEIEFRKKNHGWVFGRWLVNSNPSGGDQVVSKMVQHWVAGGRHGRTECLDVFGFLHRQTRRKAGKGGRIIGLEDKVRAQCSAFLPVKFDAVALIKKESKIPGCDLESEDDPFESLLLADTRLKRSKSASSLKRDLAQVGWIEAVHCAIYPLLRTFGPPNPSEPLEPSNVPAPITDLSAADQARLKGIYETQVAPNTVETDAGQELGQAAYEKWISRIKSAQIRDEMLFKYRNANYVQWGDVCQEDHFCDVLIPIAQALPYLNRYPSKGIHTKESWKQIEDGILTVDQEPNPTAGKPGSAYPSGLEPVERAEIFARFEQLPECPERDRLRTLFEKTKVRTVGEATSGSSDSE